MRKSINRPEFKIVVRLLRGVRESAGLTQIDLAARLKRTQTFVSAAERGMRRLDALQLHDWCLACNSNLVSLAKAIDEAIERSRASHKSSRSRQKVVE